LGLSSWLGGRNRLLGAGRRSVVVVFVACGLAGRVRLFGGRRRFGAAGVVCGGGGCKTWHGGDVVADRVVGVDGLVVVVV